MRVICTFLLLVFPLLSFGQEHTAANTTVDTSRTYHSVNQMPEFPKRFGTVNQFISSQITYPDSARAYHIEGKVIARFIVGKDGSVTHPEILKSLGYGCDTTVLNALQKMPRWIPGRQEGVPVKVYYIVPIEFKLLNLAPAPVSVESVAQHLEAGQELPIYRSVKYMPLFKGNINQYLATHIRYPKAARKADVEGRVIIQFVVDEEGRIGDIKLLNSVGPLCDAEALRVVRSMPAWEPGMDETGEPVKVYYILPILFKLAGTKR